MLREGDFVVLNDVIGCIQQLTPLKLLCQDGVVRKLTGSPVLVISGQQLALSIAEKLKMEALENGKSN